MLTLDAILAIRRHESSYGLTGKHVFGRGYERTDGTYTDETPPRKPVTPPAEDKTSQED